MTESQMLAWIKKATYEELLQKWRFEPPGSPWFVDEVGAAFQAAFVKARHGASIEDAVRISKRVGWDSQTANRGMYDERYEKPKGTD